MTPMAQKHALHVLGIIFSLFLYTIASPAHAEAPQRVVSIGGALTEIVYALGAEAALVGSDTTSYYPPEAEKMPKVGYQRTLSAEGILSLNPDLVLLTDEAGPPAVLKQLESAGVELIKIGAGRSLEDVVKSIKIIADALHQPEKADALVKKLHEDITTLKTATAETAAPKRVMFILQHGGGPALVAGKNTAADSIIALSGAKNVVTGYDGYKPLTPESAVSLKPDVILITRQGLQQAGGKDGLLKMPGVSLTEAAKAGNVVAMDSLLMLGFGPRTAQAALELHKQYQGL